MIWDFRMEKMSTVGLAYAEAKSGWTRKTRDTQNVCACNNYVVVSLCWQTQQQNTTMQVFLLSAG